MFLKCRAVIVGMLISTFAAASLGDQAASVQNDHVKIGGVISRRAAAAQLYSVHEIVSPEGITIHEFSSLQGVVFAVRWRGPFMPDLNQLLGQYFKSYTTMLASKSTRFQGVAHFSTPDLVVHSGGRLRAFSGFAYLPKQLPVGVKVEDLK
jgi:Protein of unknown function (DUF2844)